jgi:hypothetical protein
MVGIDREAIDPARPALAGANPGFPHGELPHLEIMSHEGIQVERRPVEHVGLGLQYQLAVVGVDPVDLDPAAGFVHYRDGSGFVVGGGPDEDDDARRQQLEEDEREAKEGENGNSIRRRRSLHSSCVSVSAVAPLWLMYI